MKFVIKSYTAVAKSHWDVPDESCGICSMPFDGCCTRADCKIPGEGCPPVWGRCNHAFHMHCMEKWIQTQGEASATCCLCRAPWQYRA